MFALPQQRPVTGIRVGSIESVDVMERPRPSVMLTHDGAAQRTRFAIKPFEVVTLAVERD